MIIDPRGSIRRPWGRSEPVKRLRRSHFCVSVIVALKSLRQFIRGGFFDEDLFDYLLRHRSRACERGRRIIPAVRGCMPIQKRISEAELARRARQRAMSVVEFCNRYGIGRTMAYAEIKTKRLRARKAGKRTIITEDDAEDWLRHLPVIEAVR